MEASAAMGCGTAALSGYNSTARTKPSAGIYEQLGVRPLINAIGVDTDLGGSIMPPEVLLAMEAASKHFVRLPDLQRKAGARIAELLGVPAAMVTAGCASAITVATAACVAGGDPEKLARLPDSSGMRNEIIQQKSHRSGYEAQMRLVGTKIVWIETRDEIEAAIGDRTAMMFFLNKADPLGLIPRAEWIRIGKERQIPTFNDAASDVPPVEHLWQYVREGFDLVAFSGGKALSGPQCSGLLLGRKDLIEAAMPAISPNAGIGRGMKVGKEEIAGLLAAVERYLKVDHEAERREWELRASFVMAGLHTLRGLQIERQVPPIANHVPQIFITWDEKDRGLTARAVVQQMISGEPSIAVARRGEGQLLVSVWTLRPGEHKVVTQRLVQVFSSGAAG